MQIIRWSFGLQRRCAALSIHIYPICCHLFMLLGQLRKSTSCVSAAFFYSQHAGIFNRFWCDDFWIFTVCRFSAFFLLCSLAGSFTLSLFVNGVQQCWPSFLEKSCSMTSNHLCLLLACHACSICCKSLSTPNMVVDLVSQMLPISVVQMFQEHAHATRS